MGQSPTEKGHTREVGVRVVVRAREEGEGWGEDKDREGGREGGKEEKRRLEGVSVRGERKLGLEWMRVNED